MPPRQAARCAANRSPAPAWQDSQMRARHLPSSLSMRTMMRSRLAARPQNEHRLGSGLVASAWSIAAWTVTRKLAGARAESERPAARKAARRRRIYFF